MTATNVDALFAAFLDNLRHDLSAELQADGVPVDANAKPEDVVLLFSTHRHRSVEPRRRTVHRSPELLARALEPAHATVLNAIADKSERGEDLRPHLSRLTTNDTKRPDDLLNDWGLLHFHLGSVDPEPDGYVTRSGPLLFALVRPDDLYMVDVLPHGAWAEDELVEILHNNWPDAIAHARADDFSAEPIAPADRISARRAGLLMVTPTRDGTVYAPLGGGSSVGQNRVSVAARSRADVLLNAAARTAEWCAANEDEIRRIVTDAGHEVPDPLGLRFVWRGRTDFALWVGGTDILIALT